MKRILFTLLILVTLFSCTTTKPIEKNKTILSASEMKAMIEKDSTLKFYPIGRYHYQYHPNRK